MTTPAHGKNDHRFDDLLKAADKFGEEGAKGKDALPKLGLKVARAANDGVLDLAKDKHGPGIDDAAKVYTRYADKAKKALHDHTPDSLKTQFSKLRAFIKAGRHIQFGDPIPVLDRAVELLAELAAVDPKSVKPAYAAYVDVARAITAADHLLSDQEIKDALLKSDTAKDKTVAKELAAIQKRLEKLITGDAGIKHASVQVFRARDAIAEDLAVIEQGGVQVELPLDLGAPAGAPEVEPELVTSDVLPDDGNLLAELDAALDDELDDELAA